MQIKTLLVLNLLVFTIGCGKSLTEGNLPTKLPGLDKNIAENTEPSPFSPLPGYDIYTLGFSWGSQGAGFGIWNNGTWQEIDLPYNQFAGFEVDANGKPIISGCLTDYAKLFTKNLTQTLPISAGYNSNVSSLAIYQGQPYSCGAEFLYKDNPYVNGQQYIDEFTGIVWEDYNQIYRFPGVRLMDINVREGVIYSLGFETSSTANVVLFKNDKMQQRFSHRGASTDLFRISEQGRVITTDGYSYWINGSKYDLQRKGRGITFTPKSIECNVNQNILIAGSMQLFRSDNSDIYYAGVYRDGMFDRLESRYNSTINDIKTMDGHEWLLGNLLDQAILCKLLFGVMEPDIGWRGPMNILNLT